MSLCVPVSVYVYVVVSVSVFVCRCMCEKVCERACVQVRVWRQNEHTLARRSEREIQYAS